MFCPTCGNLTTEEDARCTQCGRALGVEPQPATPEVAPKPAVSQEAPAPPEHPCLDHPGMPVAGTCARCGRFICVRCAPELSGSGAAHCEACKLRLAPQVVRPGGIRGWRVLPAIGLVLTPPLLAFTIFTVVVALVQGAADEWVAALSIAANLAFLGFSLFAAVQFFRKRKSAPRLMIIYYLLGAALPLLDALILAALAHEAPASHGDSILRGIIVSAIWVAYFSSSKQVKATFVN